MEKQQLEELKEMLDSGLVTDPEIVETTKNEISRLESEISKATSKPPKPIPERRRRTKKPAPNRVVAHAWKKKANLTDLEPVVIHCQHYHLKVDEEMEVGVKGKGSGTRKVTALPGEHLIFDDKGFLVYVMDAGSFARKCILRTTVKEHEEKLHQGDQVKELEEKINELEKENARLKESTPSPTPLKEKAPQAKKKDEPVKPKPATKPAKPQAKKKTASKPKSSTSKSPIAVIEKEINDIRKASKLPPNQAQFKKEYKDLQEKMDNKSFVAYLKKRFEDGDSLSQEQVIKLGIAIRPLLQKFPGAVRDAFNTNKKVLEANYTNLLRWAESPGNYDLQGVDIDKNTKPTVNARKPESSSILNLLGIG